MIRVPLGRWWASAAALLVATCCCSCQLTRLANAMLLPKRAASRSVARSMAAESSAISSLSPLVGKDGMVVSSEEELQERFSGKRVALYFSAGWCPMCTSFEPALGQFQAAAKDSGKPVEIVYVPSDRSETDALERAKSLGIDLAVPFDRAGDYKKTFGVWAGSEALKFGFGGRRSGVPALVVLDPNDGSELAFVPAESQGARALGNWPLDDGVW